VSAAPQHHARRLAALAAGGVLLLLGVTLATTHDGAEHEAAREPLTALAPRPGGDARAADARARPPAPPASPVDARRLSRPPATPASLAHEDAWRRAELERRAERHAPDGEAAHRAAYVALAAEHGHAALDAAVDALLAAAEPAPRAHTVGALLALRDVGTPRADALWMRAFSRLPADDAPSGVSVPGFVLARLTRDAAHDAGARELLRGVVEGVYPAPRDDLWRRAAASLAQDAHADSPPPRASDSP